MIRISTANARSPTALQRVEETRDKKQAVLVIGFPGTTMHDDDRYALELIQESCSDLGSRLFLRIREQLGLAYYVGAQNFAGLAPGYFAFYTGTEPAKAALVEKELLKEAELLRTEGLTAEELKRAKAKIIGQKKIARQDLGHLASTTALDELYGLGYQRTELDDAQIRSRHAGTNQGRRAKISQAGRAGGRGGEAGKTGLKQRSGTRCPKPLAAGRMHCPHHAQSTPARCVGPPDTVENFENDRGKVRVVIRLLRHGGGQGMSGRVHGENQIGLAALKNNPHLVLVALGLAGQTRRCESLTNLRHGDC